jgi:predicted flap endonuclease-1-like 5' DNA nuclease
MPTRLEELPKIGAPATRALHAAGYTSLAQLADVPRKDLAALHGMGPKALRILEEALAEHGLRLS